MLTEVVRNLSSQKGAILSTLLLYEVKYVFDLKAVHSNLPGDYLQHYLPALEDKDIMGENCYTSLPLRLFSHDPNWGQEVGQGYTSDPWEH